MLTKPKLPPFFLVVSCFLRHHNPSLFIHVLKLRRFDGEKRGLGFDGEKRGRRKLYASI